MTSDIPIWARVHLTHAAVQAIADTSALDIIHIKGPAVTSALQRTPRLSSDADVLVRPSHLAPFLSALESHGWALISTFAEGSTFQHAANYRHQYWAYLDVHRHLPGPRASSEEVFDRLWRDRETAAIAHHPCWVPSTPGHLFVLLLHAARSHGQVAQDPWDLASAKDRDEVHKLARALDAQVPIAAALGNLDSYADDPLHDLWAFWSGPPGSRLDEWKAWMRAQPSWHHRARVAARMLRVNRSYLRLQTGREPHAGHLAAAFGARLVRAARQLVASKRQREAVRGR